MQDRIEWLADGQFRVAGRLDAAVQVGGINVFPERVRQALLAHPAVREAAVRPMAAHEGQRLKAFVVPAPGADPAALRHEMARWLSDRLSTPEQPKAFTFGTTLPVNQRGKACDWPISCGAADLTGVQHSAENIPTNHKVSADVFFGGCCFVFFPCPANQFPGAA